MRVGFIGLGHMGEPMASHLIEAGFELVALDAVSEVEEAFLATHPGASRDVEALSEAQVIVTMLPTSAHVREALLGEGSRVRAQLRPGQLVMDMSSSQPLETRRTGAELAGLGVHMVDAPVSGGITGAQAGTLTIMLGADSAEDAALARQVLAPLSARVFALGGLGTGHAAKTLNNLVGATAFVATCEALTIAERYGLDRAQLVEVLNSSTGRNFSSEHVAPEAILTEKWNTGFTLALMTKDVGVAVGLAEGLDQPAPVAGEVLARLSEARDALPPGADHSAAYQLWSGRGF